MLVLSVGEENYTGQLIGPAEQASSVNLFALALDVDGRSEV